MIIPKLAYKGKIKHCDRYPGAKWMYLGESHKNEVEDEMTELNLQQMERIDKSLDEKDLLLTKRLLNKAELKRLKAMTVQETDRAKLHESIDEGITLIAKQTKRISALSIAAIARRLKLPYERVEYYSNKKRL